MKNYEIWAEGYTATDFNGNSVTEKALCLGLKEGISFKDACVNFFLENTERAKYFDKDSFLYYGCKLFDNEIEARQKVG